MEAIPPGFLLPAPDGRARWTSASHVPRSPHHPLERRPRRRRPRSHSFLDRIPAPPRTPRRPRQRPPRRRRDQGRHRPRRSIARRKILRRRHRPRARRRHQDRRGLAERRSRPLRDHRRHLRAPQPRAQDARRRPQHAPTGRAADRRVRPGGDQDQVAPFRPRTLRVDGPGQAGRGSTAAFQRPRGCLRFPWPGGSPRRRRLARIRRRQADHRPAR